MAKHRWAVTGTPIQNCLEELYACMLGCGRSYLHPAVDLFQTLDSYASPSQALFGYLSIISVNQRVNPPINVYIATWTILWSGEPTDTSFSVLRWSSCPRIIRRRSHSPSIRLSERFTILSRESLSWVSIEWWVTLITPRRNEVEHSCYWSFVYDRWLLIFSCFKRPLKSFLSKCEKISLSRDGYLPISWH